MNISDNTHYDMLKQHVTNLQGWLGVSISEAKSLVTKEDARDQLRAWYHKSFLYLSCTLKGLSFTEYISTHFDRRQIKDAIKHAVSSEAGNQFRTQYNISEYEHELLEKTEIDILSNLNKEYATILDSIPTRYKRTHSIDHYLCGITADELGRKFPHNVGVRGNGAAVIRVIKDEMKLGNIINIDNMSEFHRSLEATFGPIFPKVQQISRDLKKVDRHGK